MLPLGWGRGGWGGRPPADDRGVTRCCPLVAGEGSEDFYSHALVVVVVVFQTLTGGLISGCHGDLTVVVVVVAMFVWGGCFLHSPVPEAKVSPRLGGSSFSCCLATTHLAVSQNGCRAYLTPSSSPLSPPGDGLKSCS